MTAATVWILFAFLPAGYDRPPVMRIERFETARRMRARARHLAAFDYDLLLPAKPPDTRRAPPVGDP